MHPEQQTTDSNLTAFTIHLCGAAFEALLDHQSGCSAQGAGDGGGSDGWRKQDAVNDVQDCLQTRGGVGEVGDRL